MDLRHPIDAEIRARLRKLGLNQAGLAAAIGRSQGWLNKYMHGAGNATIDDVIRIAAAIIGVQAQPVTELERRLLKAWRAIPEERQEDAAQVLENVARGYRRAPRPESNGQEAHTPPLKASTKRGRRRVAEG